MEQVPRAPNGGASTSSPDGGVIIYGRHDIPDKGDVTQPNGDVLKPIEDIEPIIIVDRPRQGVPREN
jgi:hypothetical protein